MPWACWYGRGDRPGNKRDYGTGWFRYVLYVHKCLPRTCAGRRVFERKERLAGTRGRAVVCVIRLSPGMGVGVGSGPGEGGTLGGGGGGGRGQMSKGRVRRLGCGTKDRRRDGGVCKRHKYFVPWLLGILCIRRAGPARGGNSPLVSDEGGGSDRVAGQAQGSVFVL